MTDTTAARGEGELDRNLALLNYGLLFAAVFFAGIPALVAVIIAYAQRDQASPAIRSHHDFQIRIFWVAFAMSMLAAVCGLAALIAGIGHLIEFSTSGGWDAWDGISIDLDDVEIDPAVIGLIVATLILSLMTALWLIAAPAVGFIRLASLRGVGKTAP